MSTWLSTSLFHITRSAPDLMWACMESLVLTNACLMLSKGAFHHHVFSLVFAPSLEMASSSEGACE